jgi:Fe2+ or Zn2+ uptake regulation protein
VHQVDRTTELIKRAGLNVTAQRIAVFEVVKAHQHITAGEVLEQVKARLGRVSRQAVYDALTALTERGLLRRIEPAGSPSLYETRVGDNHHHVICRLCGRTDDIDCAVGKRPCLEPSDSKGFLIDEAEVVFWGVCPYCAERKRKTGTRTHNGGEKR